MERLVNQAESSQDELRCRIAALLASANVETSRWGAGVAKTMNHLVNEVASGECSLETDDAGVVFRQVEVLDVDVLYCRPDGQWLVLVEDKQVFTDGRERQRSLDFSLAEKLNAGEEVDTATIRAVAEELGVSDELEGHYDAGAEQKTLESPSYPGLTTKYIIHKRVVVLPDGAFNPSGYVENQTDKSTYFSWRSAAGDVQSTAP